MDRPTSKPFHITDDLHPEVKASEESVDAIDQEGEKGKEVADWHLK